MVQEAGLGLHLTSVQIVVENSANISLHYLPAPPSSLLPFPVSLSLCLSLSLLSIEKVKSRTIGIRLSISVFAGLCNRKRQAADGPSVSTSGSREAVAGGGSPAALGWLQRDCESRDEVSTDKVREVMDGQSGELDVRMDEGRGGI